MLSLHESDSDDLHAAGFVTELRCGAGRLVHMPADQFAAKPEAPALVHPRDQHVADPGTVTFKAGSRNVPMIGRCGKIT
jgi:hypothetical protein